MEPHDDRAGSRANQTLTIFLVSMAGLLLEVGYTRIISFKLWYYYTYLVIGLALLGIGSGGICVVLFERLRRAPTDRIVARCSIYGAASIVVGYLIVARIPVNTVAIWHYGTASSVKNLGVVGIIGLAIFASFIALGIIVSTILGRAPEGVGRLYFADLIGAGLGCLAVVPLITHLGPPEVIMLSALIFTVVGLLALRRQVGVTMGLGVVVGAVALLVVTNVGHLPDVRTDAMKAGPEDASFSEWGPVFRVDVLFVPGSELLLHDGSFGSAMHAYNGDPASLTSYDTDPRALPFKVLGTPPAKEVIIGSAAGNEILASLHFHAKKIEGVELNPVTLSLLKDHYKKLTGDLGHQPGVSLHQADGRTYLARSKERYDLVWYVAPDSYAASNAASSGSFVLSESYLYTKQSIADALKHLSNDGIMVVQFGELDFEAQPDRTARYVMTARAAFRQLGIHDPGNHMIVSAFLTEHTGDLSTIILKRTPFTAAEVARYTAAVPKLPQVTTAWAPGMTPAPHIVSQLAATPSDARAEQIAAAYPRDISAVGDDSPFFWHFVPFDSVIRNYAHSIAPGNPEISIGERVLLLLLGFSVVYAFLFLLAPFFFVRKEWRALPRKGNSAVYFAALGLGFMFFEITMIQRLVLFLGYPTYSLTVTLASILVFSGLGALLSKSLADRRWLMPVLLAVLVAVTVFYEVGLHALTNSLLDQGFAIRVIVSLVVLAPLGLCLGMFMPLGLSVVGRLSDHADEYIAWSWAVNGFFSVIGSVLTTILSMTYGFRAVQYVGLAAYAIAALAYRRLTVAAPRRREAVIEIPPTDVPDAQVLGAR